MTAHKNDALIPPQATDSDKALEALKAISGPVAGLVDVLWTTPLQKRHGDWRNAVFSALRDHESELANLADRLDNVQSIFIQATLEAMKTHIAEKREALRNAVLNTAIGTDLDDSEQSLLIRYIGELTPLHLLLLKYLSCNQKEYGKEKSYANLKGLYQKHMIQKQGYAECDVPEHIFKLLCMDLDSRGLARFSSSLEDFGGISNPSPLGTVSYNQDSETIAITPLGHDFLRYISAPPDAAYAEPS